MKLDGRQVQLLERHKVNADYKTEKQQVFIIGSKGIPANYGGFETFVEKLTEYQIRYHVARMGHQDFRFAYNGAKCFNLAVLNIGAAKAVYYDYGHCNGVLITAKSAHPSGAQYSTYWHVE